MIILSSGGKILKLRIDGSSETRTMFKIVLPLMKTSISTCLVFDFCFVWGELMWAQIVTSFADKGIPLTIGLLNFQGQYTKDWGTLTAAMCLVMIPMYALFMLTRKYFVTGLTSGSVKG
ncbi:ABC transporter permease subunit [Lacrimispora sp. 38-1]|uniref:ABC transporter permease subunit n=1 Tax=Lacrimispora sp. 38-1 TaxID=3125778 RepID=UPI003CE9EFEA